MKNINLSIFFIEIIFTFFISKTAWGLPFIILSDEFTSKNKASYSLNTIADIKNSDKIFRYTSYDYNTNYDNYNFISLTPSFRYKLSNNFIIKTDISTSYSQISGINNDKSYYKNDFNFDYTSLGLSYKINDKSDIDKVLSIDIYPLQKYGDDINYFKTISSRLSTNIIHDPLVTSLDIGLLLNNEMKFKDGIYQPANKFYIQPKVDFLANPLFSLGIGANLSILNEEKFNNKVIRNTTFENRLIFSLAHTLNEKKRWYVEASFDTSGKGGGNLSFTFDADL